MSWSSCARARCQSGSKVGSLSFRLCWDLSPCCYLFFRFNSVKAPGTVTASVQAECRKCFERWVCSLRRLGVEELAPLVQGWLFRCRHLSEDCLLFASRILHRNISALLGSSYVLKPSGLVFEFSSAEARLNQVSSWFLISEETISWLGSCCGSLRQVFYPVGFSAFQAWKCSV